jgi:antitoxin ParD1/3/4
MSLDKDLDAELARAIAEQSAFDGFGQQLEIEQLRRLWREGIESGPGRYLSIDLIKSEARARLSAEPTLNSP